MELSDSPASSVAGTHALVRSNLNTERLQSSSHKFTWKNLLSPEKKIKTVFQGYVAWNYELKTHCSHDGYEIKAESDVNEMCNLETMGVCRGWQEGMDAEGGGMGGGTQGFTENRPHSIQRVDNI